MQFGLVRSTEDGAHGRRDMDGHFVVIVGRNAAESSVGLNPLTLPLGITLPQAVTGGLPAYQMRLGRCRAVAAGAAELKAS